MFSPSWSDDWAGILRVPLLRTRPQIGARQQQASRPEVPARGVRTAGRGGGGTGRTHAGERRVAFGAAVADSYARPSPGRELRRVVVLDGGDHPPTGPCCSRAACVRSDTAEAALPTPFSGCRCRAATRETRLGTPGQTAFSLHCAARSRASPFKHVSDAARSLAFADLARAEWCRMSPSWPTTPLALSMTG